MPRVLYLHGFASAPSSRKAQYFREQLDQRGIDIEIPHLDEGNFKGLTLSGQLRVIERAANGAPVIVIGSSMGGYLAALYAARHPEVERVILMAPAFNFYDRWMEMLQPEELERWRREGELPVFHYGEKRQMDIGYQLLEDARKYESFPTFNQPGLIFHGVDDPVVPIAYSQKFAMEHDNVRLIQLKSGHELTDVLGTVWRESERFLVESLPK